MTTADTNDQTLYLQKGPATLTEMSSHDVATALQQSDVILLPFGATEAHGAHLPLGTDSMEAREICRRTALRLAAMGHPVVIGPVIPFGTSNFHLGYPGTVSLKTETLIALIRDVCMSLYSGGFRKFVFIHGHDGSLPSMMVGAQNLVEETADAECMVLNWLTPLSKVYKTIQTSTKSEGHGGEGETARLLVTHPELVHPERSEPFHVSPEEMRKLQGPEHIKTGGAIFYSTRKYPYYYIGTPGLATAETGEKGYAVIVEWLATVIARDCYSQPASGAS
ncbi:MAG TPA: creatininase family protein [Caldilineaceae bacterium]|nr:creatininase family protein [Caldilineaceae bacterium]